MMGERVENRSTHKTMRLVDFINLLLVLPHGHCGDNFLTNRGNLPKKSIALDFYIPLKQLNVYRMGIIIEKG